MFWKLAVDLKTILRDALRKCDEFKVLATRARSGEREIFVQVHDHYEQISRLLVELMNRKA